MLSTQNNWESDDLILEPREARENLRQMYKEIHLYTPIPKRDIPRKKAQWAKDPFQFLADVLPHRFRRNEKKPAPFAPFHHEMWDLTDTCTSMPTLFCGFRGSGKSSLLNFGRHIYDICHERVNYALIGSFNEYKARRLVLPIMLEIEENPMIRTVFGELAGKRIWSSKTCVTRSNIRFEAIGISQSSMGSLHNHQRPEILTIDDCQTIESARSETQGESLLFWFWSDIIPALRPMADGGWRGWILSTMVSTLSPIYKMFYSHEYEGKIKRVMYNILTNDNAFDHPTDPPKSQWPQRYSLKQVEHLKNTTPAYSWHGERQMPPVASEELLFDPEWKKTYREEELYGKDLITIAFNDPAARSGKKHDYTALPVISLDRKTGTMYVRSGTWYRHCSEDQIVQQCYAIDQRYSMLSNEDTSQQIRITICFESNGFQSLYDYIFKLQSQIRGYQPKIQLVDRRGDKILRMMGLIPYLSHGMILFLENDPDIERGLKDMFRMTHQKKQATNDDFPDALIGAISELQTIIRCIALAADDSEEVPQARPYKNAAWVLSQTHKHDNPQEGFEEFLAHLNGTRPPVERHVPHWEHNTRRAITEHKIVQCSLDELPDIRKLLQQLAQEYVQKNQNETAMYCLTEINRLTEDFMKRTAIETR